MLKDQLDPSRIIQIGMGFWPPKTVLSAVELQLFTQLGTELMTGEEIGERLGLHQRAIYDFLDTLVALRSLSVKVMGPMVAMATPLKPRRFWTSEARATLAGTLR